MSVCTSPIMPCWPKTSNVRGPAQSQYEEAYADPINAMHHEPGRRDLAWRLGLDEQDIYGGKRLAKLRNFITHSSSCTEPHGPRAENGHLREPPGGRRADALWSQDRGQHTDRDPLA